MDHVPGEETPPGDPAEVLDILFPESHGSDQDPSAPSENSESLLAFDSSPSSIDRKRTLPPGACSDTNLPEASRRGR